MMQYFGLDLTGARLLFGFLSAIAALPEDLGFYAFGFFSAVFTLSVTGFYVFVALLVFFVSLVFIL